LVLVSSPALASTRCGRVAIQGYRGTAKVRIVSGHANCAGARGLIHDAFRAFITRPRQGFTASVDRRRSASAAGAGSMAPFAPTTVGAFERR
jgi:hypothetical protein